MQRVKRTTAVAVLPGDPAGGTPGYFPQPNPGGGVLAAVPGYEWYNNVQEEIVSVITGAGLALDGANRAQMLAAIQQLISSGGSIKTPVRAATTANVTLAGSAPNTLDGVALAANDRILVKDQVTGSQNGIYVVTTLGAGANGTWSRATDADGAGEISAGMLVVSNEGAINADAVWELTTDGAITIATTALVFSRINNSLLATANTFTKAQRGAVAVLTDAATIAVDLSLGNNFSVTLAGNRTLGAPTNVVPGQSGIIVLTQDGTGSRTLAYNTFWKFVGGSVPSLTTAAGAVDSFAYYIESATRATCSLMKDLK